MNRICSLVQLDLKRLISCFYLLVAASLLLVCFSTGQAQADLGASVTLASGQPGTIYPGEITQIQITLSNSNSGAAISNVTFSNSLPGLLPNGLKISGAASYTCADANGAVATTGVLTATAGTQLIDLAGGTIPARVSSTDGTCTIVIPVTAGSSTGNSTTYTYTIASGAVTGNDGAAVANSGAVNQSINISAMARPTLSKSFSNSTVFLGGATRTLTITLTNSNPVPIPGFSITDAFPQLGGTGIIKVAPGPVISASCNNGGAAPVFAPAVGATSISATGTIPARSGATNGSCTITVAVEGNHTNGLYTTGAQTNTINASSQFTDDLGLPAAANATANITVTSPLRIAKSFGHPYLASGQTDSLTITLYNDGDSDLTVTTFDDNPIDGVVGTAYGLVASGGSTTCAGGVVSLLDGGDGIRLTGGTIPQNSSCTVTANFTGTVQVAGTPISFTNSIAQGAVGVTTGGIVSQNQSASIIVSDDLRVTKTATPASAAPGNPVRYSVTVENWSTSAINNVSITDTLANGLTFLTGTINSIDFTPSLAGTAGCAGLTVTGATGAAAPVFTIATLPARSTSNAAGSCTVTFYAMTATGAANGSSTSNQIAAGGVCYNAGATCNGGASNVAGGTVTTSVLQVTKAFNLSSPQPEGTITRMTITVTNLSANPLTGVTLADTLPIAGGGGQMRVATPSNAASTCGTPTIIAVANSTSVAINGGTVPGRASNGTGTNGSCVIQVDVVAPAGVYNNTATVAGTETYANGSTHAVGPINANASITYSSSLSAAKTFNPTAVSSGGKSTLTVRLANAGAVALANVAVTDPLPAGMVLANPTNAYTTCAGSTSITAVAGASSASLTGASIAGGGNCDFIFDVVATGAANWVNTIPIGNITASGGVSNQTAVVGTLNYNAPNNPTVAKATNPSTLTFPGQVSQLTITVTNGTQAVTNLRLSDYFTADGTSGGAANGMVVAATPAAATTCPGGIVTAAPGGTSVSLSGVTLSAGAVCTVTVNVTSTAVGGITNYIPIGSIQTNQGLSNTGQASTSLTTQSNIGISKQFTPNVVKPGQRSRLRITFYNPTALPMTSLAVVDNLPAGVAVPVGANPLTTCTGGSVTAPVAGQVQLSGGTVGAASGGVAATCYAEIDVVVAAQGDYTNTIAVGAATAVSGGSTVNNSQPASDVLRAKSPLIVHKAIAGLTQDAGNPAPFTTGTASRTPGTAATMTIRLENPNAVNLTAAAFTDTLPTGLVVGTTPNASTTCAGGTVTAVASGTSVRLTGATIPAAGNCNVTVDLLSNISGSYTNSIASGGVSTFEGVSNEEATSAQIVVSNPPTVSKQFSPSVIPPNGTSTLTIVLGNTNASAITLSAIFTDTLPTAPGALVVAATPNVVKTCPGAVTAVAGSGTVSYANGASIPAGGCTISVDVTGATPGVHTNNIPAAALQTNFGNNQQPANATLTVSTLGYISGRVFKDNNVVPNGTYESGTDTPIQAVSIELHSGATCGGALVSSTTTDVLGNYLFSGLAAGTYSVCEPVQPTGTTNGITTAGTITSVGGSTGTAGTASNPTPTTSQIVNIILNAAGGGEVSGTNGNNFAEVVPSTISGIAFQDINNNGLKDGADTALAGVTIQLQDNVNTVIATTTTAADGSYSFSNLAPGTYSVLEPTQPTGTSNGKTVAGAVANGGTSGTATGVLVLPSRIASIVLPPNTTASGNNFAEIPNGRRISGTLFLDYNNNGLLNNPPDHGIGGQTLNLTGVDINGNAVTATTTTATDGSYSFTGMPEGTYAVTQPNQPAGTTNGITSVGSTGGVATAVGVVPSVISNINLTGANTVSADNNFAEVPGAAPDLTVAKAHSPANFASSSSTGYYTITPGNIGSVATSGLITIIDTLPAGMTVAATATGTGWTCSGAVGAAVVTCTSSTVIAAGGTGTPITLRVTVGAGLDGQILTNTAVISGGGEPAGFDGNNTATDPTAIAGAASLSGTSWLDINHNRVLDGGEPRLAGWRVDLQLNGVLVATATTDANGAYSFTGLAPGTGYQVLFRHPATGLVYGLAVPNETAAAFASGVVSGANPAGAVTTDGTLKSLTLASGANIVQQSLPVDPSGVVYDAITRAPVSGATVTLSGPGGFNPAIHLVGGVANQSQVTDATGFYQFLLLAAAPAGTYTIAVTPPAAYMPGPSTIIPPTVGPFNPGAGPGNVAIQAQATAPSGAQSTTYYLSFTLSGGSAGVVNNHIPVDPILGGAIFVTKITPKVNVVRGDLVPYTIQARNTLAAALSNIDLLDLIPPGFKYRVNSARLNNVALEPTMTGRSLRWRGVSFAPGEVKTLTMVLVVGSGVGDGTYINQAWAMNSLVNSNVSNVAQATVRIVPDPTFDCTDIIGKVFDDTNANGYQDEGEIGIPNVRVATARGWLVTTDAEGRFHVPCAVVPQMDRGSNFIMKLDERTLPSGYRLTTENPRVVRATRGKLVKLNFGASIHRVVRLEVSAAAFEKDSTNLLPEWRKRFDLLPDQLKDRPSMVRLVFRQTVKDEQLAKDRLNALVGLLRRKWEELDCCYPLSIEDELLEVAK